MIGHDLTLHETNSAAAVPVCQCGWLGAVHPASRYRKPGSTRIVTNRDGAIDSAGKEHETHLEAVRQDVARQSDAVLASIGRRIDLANATFQHRGRFGRS